MAMSGASAPEIAIYWDNPLMLLQIDTLQPPLSG